MPMHEGSLVFAQLLDFIPKRDFDECVKRYHGNYHVKEFSCRDQFLAMAFAQLTYRESLRDIETCLNALQPKLYHAGFRGKVSKSTLADANKRRDWRIYADFAQVLICRAQALHAKDGFAVTLKQAAYALDSTTIDLCLTLFPWARFRRHKGAVKLHTLIDLRGNIPCFIRITHGKTADVTVLDHLPIEPGAFYMMDRGYIDFARLHAFTRQMAFFVTRAKKNLDYYRRQSRAVDKTTGLRSDQTIVLQGTKTSQLYPEPLRRVAYYDEEHDRRLLFLTNNFELPALTIAQLYRCRWQVELFFKWIKQNLRIKAFYGNSVNAVKTQVWIAVSVYVLVAILRKELKLDRSLSEILQILSVTPFEKTPICQALSTIAVPNPESHRYNQLALFNL
jgi:transposase